jgi:hypothetical protein
VYGSLGHPHPQPPTSVGQPFLEETAAGGPVVESSRKGGCRLLWLLRQTELLWLSTNWSRGKRTVEGLSGLKTSWHLDFKRLVGVGVDDLHDVPFLYIRRDLH